tara:strand:- start:35 stop:598 length:564 start_codon:yes stop_codon:yes gene_type:complete
MRIISGKYKGKKILEPSDNKTRPLKDLAKESLFNVIKHSNLVKIDIKNSSILDLFSGVGSFGLECLSRGAANVDFCENYSNVVKILKKNISNLKFEEKTEIIEEDIFDIDSLSNLKKKYEIIFIDAPFKEKKILALMKNLIKLKLLKRNGIFILHRHKKENDLFPKEFNILIEKFYGVSKIIFGNQI